MNALDFKRAASPAALRAAFLGGVLFSVSGRVAPGAGVSPEPGLSSVRQVRDVPPEQAARGYPVRLRGVVTFCDAQTDLGMFVQDATAGIYIKLGAGTNFNAGDEVEDRSAPAGPGITFRLVNAGQLRVDWPGRFAQAGAGQLRANGQRQRGQPMGGSHGVSFARSFRATRGTRGWIC